MLDLLPLGLFVLLFWKLRPARPILRSVHDDNLTADRAKSLRGVLALVIIFAHLNVWRSGGLIFPLFGKVGNLTVSVFFFLSGYGLQKQHMTRENYAKGFLAKRLRTVALPYIVVTVLYWLYYLWLGRDYPLQRVLLGLINGQPVASFSWYILASLMFYAAFWVIMRLCSKRYGAMVLCAMVWYGLYTSFCVVMNYGSWWYVSAFAAVVGIAWAVYEEKIRVRLEKWYFFFAAGTLICLVLMVLLSRWLGSVSGAVQVANVAEAAFFAITVILLTYKLRLGNPVLKFLGSLSMELYLMHGLAMMLWNNPVIRIENSLLYCVLVLLTTVVLALILHIAFKGMPDKKPTR